MTQAGVALGHLRAVHAPEGERERPRQLQVRERVREGSTRDDVDRVRGGTARRVLGGVRRALAVPGASLTVTAAAAACPVLAAATVAVAVATGAAAPEDGDAWAHAGRGCGVGGG